MVQRLNFIASTEGVNLADGALDAIMTASGGDMRKAVTYLQSAHQLCGGIGAGTGQVTVNDVNEMAGQLPANALSALWMHMQSGSFDAMSTAVADLISQGFPLDNILLSLHDSVCSSDDSMGLTDVDRAMISEKIAAVDMCLSEGASELLQLTDLGAFIQRRYNAMKGRVGLTHDVTPMVH